MKLKNLRADAVAFALCIPVAIGIIITSNCQTSKSNIKQQSELCDHCLEFGYSGCNDTDCIGTDYHIEVCLNDSI